MKKELKEWLSKQDFQYVVAEFESMNFSSILKGKCKELDEILPDDKALFSIFNVKDVGEFIITHNYPPVSPDVVGRYKNCYITSLDAFNLH